jgi:hypothetical protein
MQRVQANNKEILFKIAMNRFPGGGSVLPWTWRFPAMNTLDPGLSSESIQSICRVELSTIPIKRNATWIPAGSSTFAAVKAKQHCRPTFNSRKAEVADVLVENLGERSVRE